MRISDWSSDVCSSDLARSKRSTPVPRLTARSLPLAQRRSASGSNSRTPASRNVPKSSNSRLQIPGPVSFLSPYAVDTASSPSATRGCTVKPRSEEHTSELQSLMRISYAVFCLKKKNKQTKSDTQKLTLLLTRYTTDT